MEKALIQLGNDGLKNTEHLRPNWELVHAYPLSQGLLSLSHVWRSPDDTSRYVIAAKGAPEAIADLCHLDDARRLELAGSVSTMAEEGLRDRHGISLSG
jgi:Ca2+-transporting ATPase